MRRYFIIFQILICFAFPAVLSAQTGKAVEEMKRGDGLRYAYRFEESLQAYESALRMFPDSALTLDDSLLKLDISDRILMSENGRSMMDFVSTPVVVAKHRFSLDDFFLYYPLPDRSWRRTPCQIDSSSHALDKASYVPEGASEIFWSAEDKDGIRNIYRSEYQDTVWSAPALLNEHVTSVADEIYPMMSLDGKKIYFASEGLYGVGGYDIYVSEWDEASGDWSVPVNMGFPYSSPADDFLYADSPDGKYTVFASNRACSKDSVWVYVLEYDDMPVRHSVSDVDELLSLAALDPSGDDTDSNNEVVTDIPENIDTRRYMRKMSEVRALRDSIAAFSTYMEEARVRYSQESDSKERQSLEEQILGYEMLIPRLQDSLAAASSQLQNIEMEFLFSGVVIDPDKLLAEADREMVGHSADYVFVKKEYGDSLSLDMLEPEPEFDYSFKVLDEGQFAVDNTLPGGLVYQIQMYSSSTKAGIPQLKGLSPVFESVASNGRYTYRVGLFATYSDVLANLNTVKRAGFRNAFIVSFNDGKEISVTKAKALEAEKKKKSVLYEVRINTGTEELEMAVADGIRQQSAGKDIARTRGEDGGNVYVVGPFADKATAEKVAGFVRAMGVNDTVCGEIAVKK